MTAGRANQIGTWIFLAPWATRQSAKLNVFLGARNLNEEFVLDHLAFFRSYRACKPMNLLFALSVSALTISAVLMTQRAPAAARPVPTRTVGGNG